MPNNQARDGEVGSSAIIEGSYRYLLTRRIAEEDEGRRVLWVMLNPSTADASQDDPTIRRVLGFSRRWGYGWVEVVNLFALRATDPAVLRTARDPVGPLNHAYIAEALHRTSDVVVAWGARPRRFDCAHRDAYRGAYCLGVTREGEPRHPLYVRADAERVIWRGLGQLIPEQAVRGVRP